MLSAQYSRLIFLDPHRFVFENNPHWLPGTPERIKIMEWEPNLVP